MIKPIIIFVYALVVLWNGLSPRFSKCMFGFILSWETKSDSRDIKLILTCLCVLERIDFASRIDSNLKLGFGAFASKRDF